MRHSIRLGRTLSVFLLLGLWVAGTPTLSFTAQNQATSPLDFFGFQLGSDKKIARWDKIVDYFGQLEKESTKLKVINMGPSTMGHPFLLVIISSPRIWPTWTACRRSMPSSAIRAAFLKRK